MDPLRRGDHASAPFNETAMARTHGPQSRIANEDATVAPGDGSPGVRVRADPPAGEARARRLSAHLNPPLDPLDIEFRLSSVPAAVWTTLLICAALLPYALAADPGHGGPVLVGLVAFAVVGSLLTLRLPWDRIVHSRYREGWYGAWWLSDLIMIVAATVLDGGPQSPLILLLVIQVVFIGLSYPRLEVLCMTVLVVCCYGALAAAYDEQAGRALVTATLFVATGLMSYWQARNHERRSEALRARDRELGLALAQSETARLAATRSERRLEEAQALAHVGSWEWDLATDRLTLSAELRRIVGADPNGPSPVLGDYIDLVHPSDRERVERAIHAALGQLRDFALEHRIVRSDGTVRTLLMRGSREVGGDAVRGVCHDVTELRAIEARLRHEVDHDGLTGLLNRKSLLDALTRTLGGEAVEDRSGAVLLLDIDAFAAYNDAYGQDSGDELLCAVADLLSRRLRSSDVIARSGGDEFAVMLADAPADAAVAMAEQVRRLVGAWSTRSPVTCSIGVAAFRQDLTLVGDDVLAAADIALHDAKDRGGNQVAVYHGQPSPQMHSVQQIRTAIAEGRLALDAQPILDLRSNTVSHHELLVRMIDRQGRRLLPGAFIPTAERFGLVNAIDRWVTSAALREAARGHRVAVNLSARSIGDDRLLTAIRDALQRAVDPANLIFEITETAAVNNLAGARDFAGRLAELGCELAIDDFGTGFASFAYLKHMPARYVKIDREFVTESRRSDTDRQIVTAIVAVAHSLGKLTIAEGVEDPETLAALEALGVDYAQGFLIGRPQPVEQLSQPAFQRRERETAAAAIGAARRRRQLT